MDMIKRALTPEMLAELKQAEADALGSRKAKVLAAERAEHVAALRGNRRDRRRAAKLARQKAPA